MSKNTPSARLLPTSALLMLLLGLASCSTLKSLGEPTLASAPLTIGPVPIFRDTVAVSAGVFYQRSNFDVDEQTLAVGPVPNPPDLLLGSEQTVEMELAGYGFRAGLGIDRYAVEGSIVTNDVQGDAFFGGAVDDDYYSGSLRFAVQAYQVGPLALGFDFAVGSGEAEYVYSVPATGPRQAEMSWTQVDLRGAVAYLPSTEPCCGLKLAPYLGAGLQLISGTTDITGLSSPNGLPIPSPDFDATNFYGMVGATLLGTGALSLSVDGTFGGVSSLGISMGLTF